MPDRKSSTIMAQMGLMKSIAQQFHGLQLIGLSIPSTVYSINEWNVFSRVRIYRGRVQLNDESLRCVCKQTKGVKCPITYIASGAFCTWVVILYLWPPLAEKSHRCVYKQTEEGKVSEHMYVLRCVLLGLLLFKCKVRDHMKLLFVIIQSCNIQQNYDTGLHWLMDTLVW